MKNSCCVRVFNENFKRKTTVMWLLTCSAFYVPQVWKVTLQNTPLFSQCRRGDPGGEGWFKNSSVVRIGLSWVCLALRGNCLWLWLFMEWGWVCLLLSKQKPQNKQNNNEKNTCSGLSQGLVWNVFWEIWVDLLNQLLGCPPLATRGKNIYVRRTTKENELFFSFQRK